MRNPMGSPWWRDSNQNASGKPGAVQVVKSLLEYSRRSMPPSSEARFEPTPDPQANALALPPLPPHPRAEERKDGVPKPCLELITKTSTNLLFSGPRLTSAETSCYLHPWPDNIRQLTRGVCHANETSGDLRPSVDPQRAIP